jgi:hypothetical protein
VKTGHGPEHQREALALARPGFATMSAPSLREAAAELQRHVAV